MRRPAGRTWAPALLLLIALAALLPMRLAVDWAGLDRLGLTARSVSGTIWRGRIEAVRLGSIELGDADAWISPWPLLTGQMGIGFAGADGIEGHVSVGAGRYLIDCRVRSPSPKFAQRLVHAGFTRRGSDFALSLEGDLQAAD